MSSSSAARHAERVHPYADRMSALVESFPTLRGVPGARPWDQYKFAKWASGPAPTGASGEAAAFILSVWNGCTPTEGGWWNDPEYNGGYCVGVFDVVEAFARWDHEHEQAFLHWCCHPFWP